MCTQRKCCNVEYVVRIFWLADVMWPGPDFGMIWLFVCVEQRAWNMSWGQGSGDRHLHLDYSTKVGAMSYDISTWTGGGCKALSTAEWSDIMRCKDWLLLRLKTGIQQQVCQVSRTLPGWQMAMFSVWVIWIKKKPLVVVRVSTWCILLQMCHVCIRV